MALRPDTRTFLWSALAVIGVFAILFVRMFGVTLRQSIGTSGWTGAALFYAALFGFVLVVGLGVAWLGVLRNRKEVRSRRKPLSFGE